MIKFASQIIDISILSRQGLERGTSRMVYEVTTNEAIALASAASILFAIFAVIVAVIFRLSVQSALFAFFFMAAPFMIAIAWAGIVPVIWPKPSGDIEILDLPSANPKSDKSHQLPQEP